MEKCNFGTPETVEKCIAAYRTHSAITHLLSVEQYNLHNAYVLSNARTITTQGPITYIPVYLAMFL